MKTTSLRLPAVLLLAFVAVWSLASPAIAAPCPTTAPFAINPVGTIYDTPRPTFTWNAVPYAQSYTLYVQTVADGTIVLRQVGIVSTSFPCDQDLPFDVDLRWKVKAEATGCAAGPYSSILPFRIENAPPPDPSCPNLACFPSLKACEDSCVTGTCERRINCGGATAHKCFC